MPTTGQANALHANINSFIALLFVGSFSLAMWLVVWQVAFGENPIANAFAEIIFKESSL